MTKKDPSGARFNTFLASAAVDLRKQHGFRPEDVASRSGASMYTVVRFERGETLPQRAEQMLAAYTDLAGGGDARQLYLAAAQLWIEHGTQPTVEGSTESDEDPEFEAAAKSATTDLQSAARSRRPTAAKRAPKRNPPA